MLLVRGDLFFDLRCFALLFSFFFLKVIDFVGIFLDLLLDITNFLFGLMRFCLQVHFELFVLLFIFLESLLALVKLVFLHDNIFTQELSLFRLLVDLDLSHEDLARVVDEVFHCFLLLATFIEVLNGLGTDSLTLLR